MVSGEAVLVSMEEDDEEGEEGGKRGGDVGRRDVSTSVQPRSHYSHYQTHHNEMKIDEGRNEENCKTFVARHIRRSSHAFGSWAACRYAGQNSSVLCSQLRGVVPHLCLLRASPGHRRGRAGWWVHLLRIDQGDRSVVV